MSPASPSSSAFHLSDYDIIVFDLNTLFVENHSIALPNLNKIDLFKYTARGHNPVDLRKRLDEFLTASTYGNGNYRNKITESWLRGSLRNEEAFFVVKKLLLESKKGKWSTTTGLLRDVAKVAFTPDILCKVLELDKKMVKLAKAFLAQQDKDEKEKETKEKKEKKIFLAGNLDVATFEKVKDLHKELFSTDAIFTECIVSGQIGSVKPELDFYEHLRKSFNLEGQKYIILDGNKSDREIARSHGFNVLSYH
jgi:FMN phosphatase YigB (HAD superfamily)